MAPDEPVSDYDAVVATGCLIAEAFKVSNDRGHEVVRMLLANGILIYKK